jgi:3-oxoacyl-(acyl-carrier-protein) synthase
VKTPIAITGIAALSPLGMTSAEHWNAYLESTSAIQMDTQLQAFTARLTPEGFAAIEQLRAENTHYKRLDASVLYGIFTARKAMQQAAWTDGNFGINVGSSRGATQLFESYYGAFKAQLDQNNSDSLKVATSTLSSPTTTLGNISSWVAHDLQSKGPEISHSITCSTALHALLNGVAWLQSGMAAKFLVGGTEAALTPFTIAQMRAMKLMPTVTEDRSYPCRALDLEKAQNTMVLGEGAGMACLEMGRTEKALAYITGIGYATEILEHSASLSASGDCFQRSMQMALQGMQLSDIDVIVMHAPGTKKGDQAELTAIRAVFCNETPFLTTNKWKIGHTFGASGVLSLELAVQMLLHQKCIDIPFLPQQSTPTKLNNILINAVGFGGNAVSILLSK